MAMVDREHPRPPGAMSPGVMPPGAMPEGYDEEAAATGWHGPELLFGMMFHAVAPGQSLLDLGIGSGLSSRLFLKAGLAVHGVDLSAAMLDLCRGRGFASLREHDLTRAPYPFADGSVDHAVCAGVLNFFAEPTLLFREVGRILWPGGLFGFVVGTRNENEPATEEVGREHTPSEQTLTMHRHSPAQVADLLAAGGLTLQASQPFTVFMDRERRRSMAAMAYVGQLPPPA